MKTIELSAAVRTETGKTFAKNMRKSALIPANIYGGDQNLMISVDEKELMKAIYTPHVYIVNLSVEGKVYSTIIKETQFHPVSDKVLHIDFLQVSDKKKITIALPVVLEGQAEGAKQGGKLAQVVRKLRVNGLAKDLPESINIDITNLGLGKSIMVGDLEFKKFTIAEPKSVVIATVKTTRAAKDAAVETKK
ncbi:MAG: 50S ribosomal protein L25 [Bacteroidales bacterium]|mgnify:FL=1|nr:MAG: 50S ribosomal protein L25 [Bacteroidales bacterium]